MRQHPRSAHVRLPARPASVGAARRFVLSEAAHLGLPTAIVESAELLVSELASNAVVHAGTPLEVTVTGAGPDGLLVEVRDGSVHQPVPRHYDDRASTGRGLRLLEELADTWGVTEAPPGKTVWFRLAVTGTPSAPGPDGTGPLSSASTTARTQETIAVELLEFPVSLHAHWQERVEAMLRDHLLASLEEDDAGTELLRHAACSDALALLDEGLRAAQDEIGTASPSSDDVRIRRVVIRIPRDAVGHFTTLDETLDVAIALADSGRMLAATSDDAMRRFRRWVCREVLHQAEGGPPSSWQ